MNIHATTNISTLHSTDQQSTNQKHTDTSFTILKTYFEDICCVSRHSRHTIEYRLRKLSDSADAFYYLRSDDNLHQYNDDNSKENSFGEIRESLNLVIAVK